MPIKICNFCKSDKFDKSFSYDKKPKGETDFNIPKKKYKRWYIKCKACNHFYLISNLNFKNLYSDAYNKFTYDDKIFSTFEKIINLPEKKSDNQLRVKRIIKFLKQKKFYNKNLLDIGSGTGVFPYMINQSGFNCTALDPDKNVSKHLKKNLSLKTLTGDFLKKKFSKKFDGITLNKVIEHVNNPLKFVNKAKSIIKSNGFIYIEVPDGLAAAKKGKNREEFFIEHLHVFSKKSLTLLANKLHLKVEMISTIKEPSGKYTIFSFLAKKKLKSII